MKVQFLKEFSFIIEKDGEEVPVTKTVFRPGEAFITKDENNDYYLQFNDSYKCDEVITMCEVLDYDIQRQHSFPVIEIVIPITENKGEHIIFLITWNSNPAGLKLRVNGLPLHKVEFFEF